MSASVSARVAAIVGVWALFGFVSVNCGVTYNVTFPNGTTYANIDKKTLENLALTQLNMNGLRKPKAMADLANEAVRKIQAIPAPEMSGWDYLNPAKWINSIGTYFKNFNYAMTDMLQRNYKNAGVDISVNEI